MLSGKTIFPLPLTINHHAFATLIHVLPAASDKPCCATELAHARHLVRPQRLLSRTLLLNSKLCGV